MRVAFGTANKLIDRVLSDKKREAGQFPGGEPNILWLDLKHGLRLSAVSRLPLRSIVEKGTCFLGMNGVWQAFYGRAGDPLFSERTPLEFPLRPGTYKQQRAGWLRDARQVSSVIVSVLKGVIRLDNPWAAVPLSPGASALVMTLSDLRPEFSWFDEELQTLEGRIEAERKRIAWLAGLPTKDGPPG